MLGVNPRLDGGRFVHCLAVLLAAVLGREKVSACGSPTESLVLIGGCAEFRWLILPGAKSELMASLPPSVLVSTSVIRLLTTLCPSCSSSTSARESGRPWCCGGELGYKNDDLGEPGLFMLETSDCNYNNEQNYY